MRKIIFLLSLVLLMILPTSIKAEKTFNLKEEKIYNILIDRFNNGDQSQTEQLDIDDPYAYHGGDLKGIEKKLDDIKSFGFTTIALSPVMENRLAGYHGYWITNFQKMNEQFGSIEDLQQLVKEAHKRDMKVVLQFVTKYAAKENELFQDGKNKDWIQSENVQIDVPWNKDLVELDLENKEVQQYFYETAIYWKEKANIDGYILHAADKLPEQFISEFTSEIKEKYKDFWLIAHTINNDEEKYYSLKKIKHLDAVQNRILQNELLEVFGNLKTSLDSLYEKNSGLIFVDDPFTKRFAYHVIENGRNETTLWKLAFTYLYTADGVPYIYQGSELPMMAKGYPESQMLVQFNSGNPDLKEFIERLSALRDEFPVLATGEYEFVGSSGALSVFKRFNEDETFFIAINNDDRSQAVTIDNLPNDKQLRGYLEDNLVRQNDKGSYVITLPRESVEIFRLEEDQGFNWALISFILIVMITFIISVIYLSKKAKDS